MSIPNYYELPQVSNSNLTELARAYNALPDRRDELEDIFNFGSLVDAMLSETHKVRYSSHELAEDDGTFTVYTPDVWLQAEELARRCRRDPVMSQIVKWMTGQYVIVRRLEFTYDGLTQWINAKCKFDGHSRRMRMSAEYKTTSCTTDKQFREAVEHFHWDRATGWYLDLGYRIERHWIIGISKVNEKLFKVAVDRNNEIYKVGVNKYSFWAHRWNMLVPEFDNVTTIELPHYGQENENAGAQGARDNYQPNDGYNQLGSGLWVPGGPREQWGSV